MSRNDDTLVSPTQEVSTAETFKAECPRRRPGEITVSADYRSGRARVERIGEKIGFLWCYPVMGRKDRGAKRNTKLGRITIESAGIVRIGAAAYVLAVSEGDTGLYLAKDGKVWKYPGLRLPEPAPSLAHIPEADAREYADALARLFSDRVQAQPVATLTNEAITRYHLLVKGLVNARVLDAARVGIPRDAVYYARAVSRTWTVYDLVYPRSPTFTHALYVTLVLGLDEARAVPLIELGALVEYGIPVVNTDIALRLWQQASHLLAHLSTEWWSRSYLCDWSLVPHGSIEGLFQSEYVRVLQRAWKDPQADVVQVARPAALLPPSAEQDAEDEE